MERRRTFRSTIEIYEEREKKSIADDDAVDLFPCLARSSIWHATKLSLIESTVEKMKSYTYTLHVYARRRKWNRSASSNLNVRKKRKKNWQLYGSI